MECGSVAPTGELPLQTPATPAEARNQETVQPPKVQQNEMVAAPATLTPKPKNKLTMLDAAAIVLEKAGHPMKINDILAAMEESGIWTPGPGLTPDRTMIAAIGLETRKRVKHRFHKTAPGTFEYIGGSCHE